MKSSLSKLRSVVGPRSQQQKREAMHALAMHAGRCPEWRYWVAHQVTPGINGYQRQELVKAIVQWIRTNIRYYFEAGEQFHTPQQTLRSRLGDCDDMVILAASMFEASGVPWRFVYFADPAQHVGIAARYGKPATWHYIELTKDYPFLPLQ